MMRHDRIRRLCAWGGCIVAMTGAAAGSLAPGMPIPTTDAPIGRVVTNLEAALKENPGDAETLYRLGRAHALAYATKRSTIRGFGIGDGFVPLPPHHVDTSWPRRDGDEGQALTQEALAVHLSTSVARLTEAIRAKGSPSYYLALASVLETAGEARVKLDPIVVVPKNPFGPGVHIPPNPDGSDRDPYVMALPEARAEEVVRARILRGTLDPAKYSGACDESTIGSLWERRDDPDADVRRIVGGILADFWLEQTLDAYFMAHSLAMATEAKADTRPMGSGGLRISVEAGEGFLRVARSRPGRKGDEARLAIVETAVKELSKQQQSGGITPIIFSLSEGKRLTDLIDRDARVAFDLDGTGRRQSWPWVRPETAILVWDPSGQGRIASGRQFFGSVTWWILFGNGYEALDALNDDRDGELRGDELKGIAAWFDRNGDGVSDPGEVVPIGQLGVAAIATTPTGMDGDSPWNRAGLRMVDGRELATYDWIAREEAVAAQRDGQEGEP